MLLVLASAVILATVFYCLRFETFLFVASYDSQGHGGGIRPRLHTGYSLLTFFFFRVLSYFVLYLLGVPNRGHRVEQFLSSLSRNGHLRCCESRHLPSRCPTADCVRCLGDVCLEVVTYAMDSHVTILSSNLRVSLFLQFFRLKLCIYLSPLPTYFICSSHLIVLHSIPLLVFCEEFIYGSTALCWTLATVSVS
jgi:hypothetical protein